MRRNILHRWLGLASVAIQTASGTAGAEMTIEGISDAHAIRDQVMARARRSATTGLGDEAPAPARPVADRARLAPSPAHLHLLRQIRDEARRLEQHLRPAPPAS